MVENTESDFTAAEDVYFESKGETILPGLGEDTQTGVDAEQGNELELEAELERELDPEGGEPEQLEPEKKGGVVPHGALHAERERRKEAEAKNAETMRRLDIVEDRWNTLLAVKTDGTPAAEPEPKNDQPPDPATDFIGYVMWQGEQLKRIEAEKVEKQQQTEAERADTEVWNTWESAVEHARTIRPDFDTATNFLSDLRNKQLEAMSIVDQRFAHPQARINQINAELKDIVAGARARGVNPAQAVYELAQNFGYSVAPAQTGDKPAETANVHQQTMDKIAALDDAQNASRTLGASGGTNTGDPLSVEAIADMSPAEFEAWMKDPKNEHRLNTMMGSNS